ncbi:MAG: S1 RNA-binding domain-containing protein [Clostridiales bacterium]|nr:S1 RNA-binding domain-containing protein [Clostridiales bacterium]
MELAVGTVLEGKVTGITKFGAFVTLPEGKSGMVHISEVANTYVNDIKDHLTEGQEVKVKVISIDEMGRIGLSIKKALPPPPRKPMMREASFGDKKSFQQNKANLTFEDKLKMFMQDSESKMSDLKGHIDKRSGSRRPRSK